MPTWMRFLDEVFDADSGLIEFVQRFAGYSLTGDVREQLPLFAHGRGQRQATMSTRCELAGDYGVQLDRPSSPRPHDQHPTGLTDLRGARSVTTIETEAGSGWPRHSSSS